MPSPDAPRDFDVRIATPDDTDAVLAALSDGYGRPYTRKWFEWKHLGSPWGASTCFVAVDEGGLLGVVFQMPWPYRAGTAEVQGWRMVDGATTVRAQRRGVFRKVVAAMLDNCAANDPKGVVLATATPEARAAHIKNGADALEPIRSYYRPAPWVPAKLLHGCEALDTWRAPASTGIATSWSTEALEWRLDPRSGIAYRSASLADRSAGAVYRTAGRPGLHTLVLSSLWGSDAAKGRLVRALAWHTKSVAFLMPAGPGTTAPAPSRLSLARGESLMCVWDQRAQPATFADGRDGWALDGLDLEGVI
jgi:hypothetical protein